MNRVIFFILEFFIFFGLVIVMLELFIENLIELKRMKWVKRGKRFPYSYKKVKNKIYTMDVLVCDEKDVFIVEYDFQTKEFKTNRDFKYWRYLPKAKKERLIFNKKKNENRN